MTELTQGVSNLIERIKNEGISAGQVEHDRIIAEAKATAENTISSAQQKAKELLENAQKEAADLKARVDAELRLSVRDFVAKFQKRIKDHLIQPVISSHVRQIIEDPEFLNATLMNILTDYTQAGGSGIEAVVNDDLKDQLAGYFTKAVSEKLEGASDLTMSGEQGLTGFRLRRQGEGFTWDFTLEAIVSELAHLVEPGLRPFFSLDT